MKTKKLWKSILIPMLGISTIGTIAAISTSCEEKKPTVVPVTGVKLDKTSVTLAVGETETLTKTVLPETATDKSVTWSSNKPSIATVDSNGKITAVGLGTATIIITTHDSGKIATCEVTVDTIHVTSVTLNKTSVTLAVGETETLTATVSPETATEQSVTWTSSDSNVAAVDSDGTITAIAVGTATITATSVDNKNAKDACEVTVNPIHVTGVTLDKIAVTLAVDDTETLTATVLPTNATNKDVTWTSSNLSVATVKDGVITAVGLGNATITVTTNDGGKTATCEVNVNTIHVESVTLDKNETTLYIGKTEKLTATVLPENATNKDVTWTSSDTNVATVDSNGTITAVYEGTATITVKTHDGGKTATCVVNVNSCISITANEGSTLTLNNNGGNNPNLQYSTDGTNWTTYSAPINIPQGQSLYLKGNNSTGWSHSDHLYSALSITGNVSISGNVMGLLDNGAESGEEGDITAIPCDYCFYYLFEDSTGITSVNKNFLPATSLTNWCYSSMFRDCSSLTTAPELPATNLANGCYLYMFENCASLTTAPTLPATTLAYGCYQAMFEGCSSLTTAPELPATNLADGCYEFMFGDCSSLTTAPTLPATTLAEYCYYGMFDSCSSLTTAPELPARNLNNCCYWGMFQGCSSLTTAPYLPAIRLVSNCYGSMFRSCTSLNSVKIAYTGHYYPIYFSLWVNDVASPGVFYYNGGDALESFGFPSGWKRQQW